MRIGRGLVLAVGAAMLAAGAVEGVDALPDPPAQSETAPPSPSEEIEVGHTEAGKMLEQLPVKGRAPMTDYDRDEFGPAWSDDVETSGGHQGCDQRNDVLRRDLDPVEIKPGTNGCVALSGVLEDPYSGDRIDFTRGVGSSGDVPVDHVVALGNAWATGAQQLSEQQRRSLANDPLNLQPTRQDLNSQKSDGDAATWLPPAKTYRCTYATRQIMVKDRYELWVTRPEKEALARVLSDCSGDEQVSSSTWDVPALSDP